MGTRSGHGEEEGLFPGEQVPVCLSVDQRLSLCKRSGFTSTPALVFQGALMKINCKVT